jgi:hypothetical protein
MRAHIDFLVEGIAGDFLTNPTRKDQLLVLLFKLDFGNNDAVENAVVNIDLPRCPGILDKETLLLQSIILADG